MFSLTRQAKRFCVVGSYRKRNSPRLKVPGAKIVSVQQQSSVPVRTLLLLMTIILRHVFGGRSDTTRHAPNFPLRLSAPTLYPIPL